MSIFLPTEDADRYRQQEPPAPEPQTSVFDRPSWSDTGPVGPMGPVAPEPSGYPSPVSYANSPKTLEEARALAASQPPAPEIDQRTGSWLRQSASEQAAGLLTAPIAPWSYATQNDPTLAKINQYGALDVALSPLTYAIPSQVIEHGVGRVARGLVGGAIGQQVADRLLPEDINPLVRIGVDTLAAGAGAGIADAGPRIARRINAAGDRQALGSVAGAGEYGRGKYQDVAFPRQRVVGGAPFSEDALYAQQAHLERMVGEDPNLSSAIAKIQDNLAIEEQLRARGGIAEQELRAGRRTQLGRVGTARDEAASGGLTISEAARLASEEAKTGKFRKTFAPGTDLTDDESRAISRLLATSPALEGKQGEYLNYTRALDDFLKGGDIQPEQRKRLSDLLGVQLERKPQPARGARGERFAEAGTNQYPARITGEQQAPVTQTFRNEPQQEIAGRARIIGGDGQVKEGVIQPSLFEPDTYMVVDPQTGQPIPDFRPDGTPIPGSEIRRTSGTIAQRSRANIDPFNPARPGRMEDSGLVAAPGIEGGPPPGMQASSLSIDTPPIEGFSGAPENARSLSPAGMAEGAMRGREGPAYSMNIPTPGGPQQFPEQLWSPEAGMRAPAGREVEPLFETYIDPRTGAQRQRLIGVKQGAEWPEVSSSPLAPDAPPATDKASLLARRRQFAESITPPGAGMNIPSPGGPSTLSGANRGRQIAMPGVTRHEQQRGTIWQNVKDLLSGVRTVQSAGDVSMTSRQARRTILAYNKRWRAAVKDEINAFVRNEDAAWKVSDRIDASPNRARYDEMGIDLPDPNNYDLSVQEEAFMHGSSMAARAVQRVPLVKRSERAAAVFMKSLRSGIADDFIGKFTPEQWSRLTVEDKQAIGKFINATTGRGSLPEVLQRHSQTLGAVFYSPRNQIANVQIPATVFFGRNSATLGKNMFGIPKIRGEAAKALVADYAAKWALRGLIIAAGGKVGLDIQSSDWGKIITPDGQRIDMDGGDNQMMRLIANLYAGGSTSRDSGVFTKRDRREIAWNYLRNKFAPVPGTADRLTDNIPNDSPGEEAFNAGAYLWLQDVVNAVRAAKEQGKTDLAAARMALTSATGGQIGIGVDSPRSPQLTTKAGNYDQLAPEQQVEAFSTQAWKTLGEHPGVPAQFKSIIGNYQSEAAWKNALIEEYTGYYTRQGVKPGVASELARQAAERHPIAQYFSNVRNYYESQWIRQNPALADRIKAEDAQNPGARQRLSTTRADLAAIQSGQ